MLRSDLIYICDVLYNFWLRGFSSLNENVKELGAFVMRAPDDDIEEFERNDENTGEPSSMTGTRFSCTDLDLR